MKGKDWDSKRAERDLRMKTINNEEALEELVQEIEEVMIALE